MKQILLVWSLSMMMATLSGCQTATTPNPIQPSTQTQENEAHTQTEAEVLATDGLMFAQAYDLPAEIALKRLMFEHHQDFVQQRDALIANYQKRLISQGFSSDNANGGHYLVFLTAGSKPKDHVIVRKGKLTEQPKHSDIDPKILSTAIALLQTDTALPIQFIVLNISQKDYQMAQKKIQNPVIFAQLKRKIPDLHRLDLSHDNEKIYAILDVEKKAGLDKAAIAKIAKQILKLDVQVREVEQTKAVLQLQ